MKWLAVALRSVLRAGSNLIRRIGRAPDVVSFTLEGALTELSPPPGSFLRKRLSPRKPDLQDLARAMRHAAFDTRVRGIVLHLAGPTMTPATAQSLRDLILSIREQGTRVSAWGTRYGMLDYYVACACDEILLQQAGAVTALGLGRTYLFLADALQKVGLEGDFVQITPYKTAADMLTRRSMSEEAREMADWLTEDLFEQLVMGIASGRGISEDRAREIIHHGPFASNDAAEQHVVDAVIGAEELPGYLAGDGSPARVEPYATARRKIRRPPISRPGRYVAVLRLAGDIIDGRSAQPPIQPPFGIPLLTNERAGDLTVVQQARVLARDRRAGAVVLHVDSGGGSAAASEAMAAALAEVAARKPLVVSMGSVAASGGYYLATPGAWILAQPGTLTGSIGVLSGKLVNAGLFEKLLFHRETVERGDHAGFYSSARPFTEQEREQVHTMIHSIYDVFLDRVCRSRGLSRETADGVAGGRVWTGRQALDHQLVDELGGLDRAIEKAKSLAHLHSRARIRLARPPRKEAAPLRPQPSKALAYLREGSEVLGRGRALCLMPLIPWDDA